MVTSLYMCVIVMMLRVYLHVFHTGVNPSYVMHWSINFSARKHVLPRRSSIYDVCRYYHTRASADDHDASADDCRLRGRGSPRISRGLFGSPPATDLINDQ